MFKSCHTAFCWSIWHQASSAECQRLVLSKLDDSPTPTMTMMPQCWQWQWQQQKHFSVQQQQQQETPYKVSGWATTIHLLKALTITNNNNYTYIHTQKQTTNNKQQAQAEEKAKTTVDDLPSAKAHGHVVRATWRTRQLSWSLWALEFYITRSSWQPWQPWQPWQLKNIVNIAFYYACHFNPSGCRNACYVSFRFVSHFLCTFQTMTTILQVFIIYSETV